MRDLFDQHKSFLRGFIARKVDSEELKRLRTSLSAKSSKRVGGLPKAYKGKVRSRLNKDITYEWEIEIWSLDEIQLEVTPVFRGNVSLTERLKIKWVPWDNNKSKLVFTLLSPFTTRPVALSAMPESFEVLPPVTLSKVRMTLEVNLPPYQLERSIFNAVIEAIEYQMQLRTQQGLQ